MDEVKKITIEAYDYPLPEHRIARYPLAQRDQSKLLLQIGDHLSQAVFSQIGNFLPQNSLLITNETKVIKARLLFKKEGGAAIEVFCLEPQNGHLNDSLQGATASPVVWKCFVGNSKRWKSGQLKLEVVIQGQRLELIAERVAQTNDHSLVQFSWNNPTLDFSDLLAHFGELPLPPYLNRKAEKSDLERYQTVFAKNEGSVAAPTAGLHFSADLVATLKAQGVQFEKLTLHVGAGTFKPVATDTIGNHAMHAESFFVARELIVQLINHIGKPIIPVGTTSMRTLESLYWLGVSLMKNSSPQPPLDLLQWTAYHTPNESQPSAALALTELLKYISNNNLSGISASTALMIAPGYRFRVATGLITNFHQPKSTLLLLVAALIGKRWQTAYQYALDNDFRFLSYGDGCLMLPEQI